MKPTKIVQRKIQNQQKSYKGRYETNKILKRKIQNQQKSYKGRSETNKNLTEEDTKPTKIL